MPLYPKPVRPSHALADLVAFVRGRRKHEVIFGLLAVVMTGLWFWAIFDKLNPAPEWKPPKVMYVKQWPSSRTAADVRAQQALDAPRENAERDRIAAEAAARQAAYKRLAKQLGI